MRNQPFRLPLPASRQELVQVLDRLRDDTWEKADRQLLMRLVEQVIGPDPGIPPTPPPTRSTAESENAVVPETPCAKPETQRRGHGPEERGGLPRSPAGPLSRSEAASRRSLLVWRPTVPGPQTSDLPSFYWTAPGGGDAV